MPRYATIITADDGAEIVSAIGEFEGSHMPLRSGRVEEVAPGVLIGMVRGGPVGAVAGFGFPRQGLHPAAVITTTARLKAVRQPEQFPSPKAARTRPRKKPAGKAAKARTSAKASASGAAVDG
ncbi:hypothetical protein [Mesorhizobium sp.]|uniref:hypothetical protein n=1 Tax=Mesorhizobium sp. TaxID=1871066 RepID=UPI0025E8D086|nr:hypothetical protein [Mesorhizobium sp.]